MSPSGQVELGVGGNSGFGRLGSGLGSGSGLGLRLRLRLVFRS